MSDRAQKFVAEWLEANFNPVVYEDDKQSESKENAEHCLANAEAEGIPLSEIEEEFGDLAQHFARLHERAIDREVDRLAAKDD